MLKQPLLLLEDLSANWGTFRESPRKGPL